MYARKEGMRRETYVIDTLVMHRLDRLQLYEPTQRRKTEPFVLTKKEKLHSKSYRSPSRHII